MNTKNIESWAAQRIKQDEINKYLEKGKDFIEVEPIEDLLNSCKEPDAGRIKDILAKSKSIQTLTLEETAYLLNVVDPKVLSLMQEASLSVKKKVYDNRIVTFAPLYLGNRCINECLYCGFRKANDQAKRKILDKSEVRKEVEALAGIIGHKRLIVVYGEHPETGVDYMVDTIKEIYDVKVKTKNGFGQIRRVNVNAAPMSVAELALLKNAGLGTYQVFQETYHKPTYSRVHPNYTVKGNYRWRLYSMHRAMEAGIDDVGLGVLFGLYNWKFEVLAIIAHDRELERKFNIGSHTISFPRLEPASNSRLSSDSPFKVNDEDFKKLIVVLRLAVPHTGLIITARESANLRREVISFGITQTDASTKIGVGAYCDNSASQKENRQQFILGDTRSLDEVIREFASMGYITSFCTAGYRCGRTGECIMELLRSGKEGKFCKLNAVLTFKEWLDDFASPETKLAAQPVIEREIKEINDELPKFSSHFLEYYHRIEKGERDLYF